MEGEWGWYSEPLKSVAWFWDPACTSIFDSLVFGIQVLDF